MEQIATNALCTLFSRIIELEYIPKQFKEDIIIVPIRKGGGTRLRKIIIGQLLFIKKIVTQIRSPTLN